MSNATATSRKYRRELRQKRVRRVVKGTVQKPRLCVYRSLKYTYAQLIADDSGQVIASASSKGLQAPGKSTRHVDSAKLVGSKIAELAKEKQIDSVVFDRNGYLYHGRVAAVAEGARAAGLKF